MTFRLKNIGATYQKLVAKMFKTQIGQNMELYVNDLLVKNKMREQHLQNFKKACSILW